MTKLLRKYNKWLIAIFGSFLMVSFLLGSTINFLGGDPMKRTIATLDGAKIRTRDLVQATSEYDVLLSVVPRTIEQLGIVDATHWLLLRHEAAAQGLIGTPSDGDAWLDEIGRELVPDFAFQEQAQEYVRSGIPASLINEQVQRNPQFRDQLARQWLSKPENQSLVQSLPATLAQERRVERDRAASRNGMQIDDANLALARIRGVQRLVGSSLTSNRLSDRRFQRNVQQAMDAVLADVLIVRTNVLPQTDEPDEATLSRFFEAHKDVFPNPSTNTPGYRLPERVQLRWFSVSRAALEGALTIDSVAARVEHEKNRATYPGDFATERGRIEGDLRAKLLANANATIEQSYRAQQRLAVRDLESDGAFKVLPADWKQTARPLSEIAAGIVEGLRSTNNVTIPVPAIEERTAWVRIDRLSDLPVIGTATLVQGGSRMPFAELVRHVRELDPTSPLGLQVGVPFEGVLTSAEGDRVMFVIDAVRANEPPASLDEVRDLVLADARAQMVFDSLDAFAPVWKQVAIDNGLDDLAAKINAGTLTGQTPASEVRVERARRFAAGESTVAMGMGTDPLRDALVEAAKARGMLTPATEAERASRSVATPIPQQQAVAFAQIVGVQPLTIEQLRAMPFAMADRAVLMERGRLLAGDEVTGRELANPFSPQALAARLKWKPVEEEDKPASDTIQTDKSN